MKGFPNQVSDLRKVNAALKALADILAHGDQPSDDLYGPELVRAGVAGAGRSRRPVEDYIREQKALPAGRRSIGATARGMRELLAMLRLTSTSTVPLELTQLGRRVVSAAPQNDDAFRTLWRGVIQGITVGDQPNQSHPYQVLIRLVSRKPGITRAKSALALEAIDDSEAELDRICALSDMEENDIRHAIAETQANWDNAKKILPSFAEQLGDVIKEGHRLYLSDAPGRAEPQENENDRVRERRANRIRRPRASRAVTPDTIGSAGLGENHEPPVPPDLDPQAMAAAIAARADRLRRHNLLVRKLASLMPARELYEDPFDILAVFDEGGVLVEVKTLNGEADDERHRVRDALSQLLYYEAFVTEPLTDGAPLKVAAFELRPSAEHIAWLRRQGIISIWETELHFACCAEDMETLTPFLSEFELEE